MAAYFRMMDLTTISGNDTQDKRDAIDVGAYRHPVVQVRVPENAGASGTLYIQHAATLYDDAFLDYDSQNVSVDLTADTNVALQLADTLRYLRLRWESVSTQAQVLADAIAR